MGRYESPPEILENFRNLIRHLHEVVLGTPDETNADAVERDIAFYIGPGKVSATMLGRYLNTTGKGEYLKREVRPSTYLAIAQYIQQKTKAPRWGTTDQDALTAVYDWVVYGPNGAPENAPANRHSNRKPAAQILVEASKTIEALAEQVLNMSNSELLQGIALFTDTLIQRGENKDEPDPAMAPQSPCEDDKPLPTLILIELGRSRPTTEAERGEAVADLAQRTRIEPERCRDILCGQEVSADELALLAPVVRRSQGDLMNFALAVGATRHSPKFGNETET
jgi:hypothetical protein